MKNFNKQQQGFSLVELLIASLISMIILLGLIQVSLASRANFEFQEQMGVIHESARLAFQKLEVAIKNSKRMPIACTTTTDKKIVNMIWNENSNEPYYFAKPNQIYPLVSDEINRERIERIKKSIDQSHVLAFATLDFDYETKVNNIDKDMFVIELHKSIHVPKEPTMMMFDQNCSQINLFLAQYGHLDKQTSSVDVVTVRDNKYEYKGLVNCERKFYGQLSCINDHSLQGNSEPYEEKKWWIIPYQQQFFYIKDSVQNDVAKVPALYLNEKELAQGVESLVIYAGIDSDNDFVPNQYIKVDQLAFHQIEQAVSYKVELSVRSLKKVNEVNDGFIRKQFSQTYQLRN